MSQKKKLWRTFWNNRLTSIGSVISGLLVLIALLTPWISPYDPLEQDVFHRLTPPEQSHFFGTDEYGRDVLSRLMWGARISLSVGLISVILGLVLGTAMGMVAGFVSGKTGTLIMRTVDVLLCFPTLITGIMVVALLGTGVNNLIITIGIVFSPRFARLAYGPTLTVREAEYIDAARVVGAGFFRILLRHLLPNIFSDVLVAATLWVGTAIILEASLSFLGLGVPPPTPTWGNMIKTGMDQLSNAPWLCISPSVAILIAVLAFNMIGDGVRDIADPKLQI